jgi:ribosomal protein L15E
MRTIHRRQQEAKRKYRHYQPFQSKNRSDAITCKKVKLFIAARKAAEKGPGIDRLNSIPTGKVGHQYYPILEVIKMVWLGTWNTAKCFRVLLTDGEQNVEMSFHSDHAKRLLACFSKRERSWCPGLGSKLLYERGVGR